MKKILMPVIDAGSGHRVPGMAVKESIEVFYPGKYQIEIIDFAKEAGALGDDKRQKGSWDFLLKYPFLARLGYNIMEVCNLGSRPYLKWFARDYVLKGMDYLERYKPDILFIPHMFSISVCAMAREKGKLDKNVKILGYITDPFDACPWWTDNGADYIIVSSERAKQRAMKFGIEEKKIVIIPFPVKSAFFKLTKNRDELIRQYNIDISKKTIITSAGGQGIGTSSAKYVEEMYRNNMLFNILFVCGKNQGLKDSLDKLKNEVKSSTNLIPFGYVNNMNELLSISDFILAKAGASTTMESLMMGVPIVYTDFAAYNEKTNIDFVVANSCGWYTPNRDAFFKVINQIQNSDILLRYKENIKKLNLKSGSDEMAKFVVTQLES